MQNKLAVTHFRSDYIRRESEPNLQSKHLLFQKAVRMVCVCVIRIYIYIYIFHASWIKSNITFKNQMSCTFSHCVVSVLMTNPICAHTKMQLIQSVGNSVVIRGCVCVTILCQSCMLQLFNCSKEMHVGFENKCLLHGQETSSFIRKTL